MRQADVGREAGGGGGDRMLLALKKGERAKGKGQRNSFCPRAFREEHTLLAPGLLAPRWQICVVFSLYVCIICCQSSRKQTHPFVLDLHIGISPGGESKEGSYWLKCL